MTPTMDNLRRTPCRAPCTAALSLLFFVLSVTWLAPAPADLSYAAAVDSPHAPGSSAAEIEARLRDTMATIEQAFVRCDPSLLETVLPRRMKIYFSTSSFGIDPAYYGPDQLLILMQRVCEGRTTLRFVPIAAPRQPQQGADTTLTAQWISRAPEGAEDDVRLAFVFAPDESTWQIREVRQLK